MRRASQDAPGNAIFVVAAAEALPTELDAAVSELSIYFPWGSLLKGLVAPSPAFIAGVAGVLRPGATLTALLSITEHDGGRPLCPSSIDVATYASRGLQISEWRPATSAQIAASDSSWAKRLAAGVVRPVWSLRATSVAGGPRA
jgi:16S rRNA (adenine(1408)-N(1))-methyltransferase